MPPSELVAYIKWTHTLATPFRLSSEPRDPLHTRILSALKKMSSTGAGAIISLCASVTARLYDTVMNIVLPESP